VDRGVNDNFKFNQETEFVPILSLIASQLNGTPGDASKSDRDEPVKIAASSTQENHHPALLSVLADELSVASEEIHDFELYVPNILAHAVKVLMV
jgi:aspartyl aminopeptidase